MREAQSFLGITQQRQQMGQPAVAAPPQRMPIFSRGSVQPSVPDQMRSPDHMSALYAIMNRFRQQQPQMGMMPSALPLNPTQPKTLPLFQGINNGFAR